jgi:hypothetical protein
MLTAPGEEILLHAPTYVGFTHVLENTGRNAVHSDLIRDEQGVWRMDYEDMDRKLKEHKIHLAIFCSPHNPTGRVWERWEIERAMEIYAKNDCVVISDEIWSDIIMPGFRHIPTQSVSEDAKQRSIAFYAPSKTFSLAGLIGSYHVVYNDRLRDRLRLRLCGRSRLHVMRRVRRFHIGDLLYGPGGRRLFLRRSRSCIPAGLCLSSVQDLREDEKGKAYGSDHGYGKHDRQDPPAASYLPLPLYPAPPGTKASLPYVFVLVII